MRGTVIIAILLALAAAGPMAAADFELGMRYVILASSENESLTVAESRGFAAVGEAFFTPRVSVQLAAMLANPEAMLGSVDVGTVGIRAYSAVARFHLPLSRRLSAYAGGGAASVQLGDLDDQLGDAIEVQFDRQTAFLAEAGVRYRLLSNVYLDAGVRYMPVEADARIERSNVAVPARVELDPVTINVSGSWRF
jgi:outer membrane protein W